MIWYIRKVVLSYLKINTLQCLKVGHFHVFHVVLYKFQVTKILISKEPNLFLGQGLSVVFWCVSVGIISVSDQPGTIRCMSIHIVENSPKNEGVTEKLSRLFWKSFEN